MDQPGAELHILSRLRHGLSRERTYHNFSHTLDVYRSAVALAMQEKVGEDELDLLRTAALYHDAGYLVQDHEHEEAGCRIAREALPNFGYSEHRIERVCEMIMATKMPPSPKDHLAEILCDADLDYLGRPDFFRISTTLFWEFQHFGIVKDELEWNLLQLRFMESHTYFTGTARNEREEGKQKNLERVRAWLRDHS